MLAKDALQWSATWAGTPPATAPPWPPTEGKKEYKDDEGRVVKVYERFGYKLHLLVDVQHEVALAYHISDTKLGDNEGIEALVEEAQENLGANRIETLAYDKAADDKAVHEMLTGMGLLFGGKQSTPER